MPIPSPIHPAARPVARTSGRRVAPAALALAALAAGACSKGTSSVTAPPPPPPPEIVSVFPAPRSALVDYLSDIWAQFDQPLDPATVNARTVYLKLDTTRLPVAVTYDSTLRRVHVRPTVTLALLTTYTVEISSNVLAANGRPLGGGYLWQFSTQSVRHPSNPFPADGAMDSPLGTLSWGGNESTPGTLVYELYADSDSAAVAARTAPMLYRGPRTLIIPRMRWHEGGANYWSITVENQTQGERYSGAVWRFDTPDAGVPIDSLDLATGDFGYAQVSPLRTFCQPTDVISGSNYRTMYSWQLLGLPTPFRVARVQWLLSSTAATQDSLSGPVGVYGSSTLMSCGSRVNGSADFSSPLAVGTLIGPRTLAFDSDYLAAYLEAAVRRGGLFGYFIVSQKTTHFVTLYGSETDYRPRFRLWVYRVTSPPQASAGSKAAAASVRRARAPALSGSRVSPR